VRFSSFFHGNVVLILIVVTILPFFRHFPPLPGHRLCLRIVPVVLLFLVIIHLHLIVTVHLNLLSTLFTSSSSYSLLLSISFSPLLSIVNIPPPPYYRSPASFLVPFQFQVHFPFVAVVKGTVTRFSTSGFWLIWLTPWP